MALRGSEAMWKLHLLMKEELEAWGITVKQTRTDQTKDLDVTDRGRAAKGSDLLLSLHSNAVGSGVNESIDYPVVYHLAEDAGTDADDRSKLLAEHLAPSIASAMGTKQDGRVATRLAKTDKNKDGVLNDNYYGVLNGARQVNVPALIVEHSFHTNTSATNWLLQDENLRYLAQVEATQIASVYFGITDKHTPAAGNDITTTDTKEGYEMNMRTLYKGCKGEDVRAMQQLLTLRGVACDPDGSFGPDTDAALRAYQKATGLEVDGRAGPATMTSLLGVDK